MKRFLLSLLFLSAGAGCLAQSDEPDRRTFMEWINDNVSVRKAFDGTRNEAIPAFIQYLKDFETDSNSTFSLDLGVKIIELQPFRDQELVIYPTVEWHKQVKNGDPEHRHSYNNWSADINVEFGILDVSRHLLSPTFIGSAGYTNDIRDETETISISILTTLFGLKTGTPGTWVRNEDGAFRLRYYPYAGYEFYSPIAGDNGQEVSYLVLRFSAEYYPFSTPERRHLQVSLENTFRARLNDAATHKQLNSFTVELNWYLTEKEDLALSTHYTAGRSPATSFTMNNQLALGLSYKL